MRFLFLLIVSTTALASPCPQWSPEDAEQRLSGLAKEITRHNNLYFHRSTTEISDTEYDQLRQHLSHLNACFPSISLSSSSVSPEMSSQQQAHQARMSSLRKASDEQVVKAFLKKAEGHDLLLQPKIDGIAIELVYKKGALVSASTRGNGRKGRNILPQIKKIVAIPKDLTHTEKVILHGELFARLDKLKDSDHSYTSARHFVAAHINRSEPDADAMRQLDFFPWQWVNAPFQTGQQAAAVLAKEGLTWVSRYTYKISSLKDVHLLRQSFHHPLKPLPFLLDGIVIKLDNLSTRQQWGASQKAPHWALAWKFPAITAITQVTDISFSIGRTGTITPTITVNPTNIGKLTISSISLGSLSTLKKKGVSIGDHIIIELVGRAAPVFKRVLIQHPENRLPQRIPDPARYNGFSCLRWSSDCHQQFFARLQRLTGKNGLNLPHLHSRHLSKLIYAGKIQTLSQLFTLSGEDFTDTGLNFTQSSRLQTAILLTSALPFEQRLLALSLPGMGNKKVSLLARHYQDFQALGATSPEELAESINSSYHVASQLQAFLKLPELLSLVSLLSRREVN